MNVPFVQSQINQAKGISSAVPKLALCRIQNLNIVLSSWEEQERIENTVATHDERINQEESYVVKLKFLKKSLMQDLLTGRVKMKLKEDGSMSCRGHHEGLRIARLLMVMSSISPLFILWAIRGNNLISDKYFIGFCAVLVILPNLFLWLRIRTAKKLEEKRECIVGSAEDHREHLLVYLFAMLLPFYTVDIGAWRDFAATLAALTFIVFLFLHLHLHYMNLFFAVLGYRVFTVASPADGNPLSGKMSFVLITRRVALAPGDKIIAYRLSDTVYFEEDR